jgi:hypothetical protein
MKNGFIYLIIGLVVIFLVFNTMKSQSILGSETMTRTIPATVQPNAEFSVTYTSIGTSGKWAATVIDSVSGGCLFSGLQVSSVNTYLLSTSGTTKTMTIKAPTSGSCTFSGTYQFGDKSIGSFQSNIITVSIGSTTYNADLNSNGVIESSELLSAITKWVNNGITKTELQSIITSWKGA